MTERKQAREDVLEVLEDISFLGLEPRNQARLYHAIKTLYESSKTCSKEEHTKVSLRLNHLCREAEEREKKSSSYRPKIDPYDFFETEFFRPNL